LIVLYVIDAPRFWYATLDGDLVSPGVRSWRDEWMRVLPQFAPADLAGLPIGYAVEAGSAAEQILRIAEERECDLIMMPAHGCDLSEPLVIGPVTETVLRQARQPVWVACSSEQLMRPSVPRSILCAMELSGDEFPLLQTADRFAAELGARLAVFHAAQPEFAYACAGAAAQAPAVRSSYQAWERLSSESRVRAPFSTAEGDVASAIRTAALDEAADLLIIGREHLRGEGEGLGTHVFRILGEAPCPVLVA
jgi:nucleotide-binding universal stress UspA family protein